MTAASPSTATVLLYNATAILPHADAVEPYPTWLTADPSTGKILRIQQSPADAPPLDSTSTHHNLHGLTLLPGLIDSHIHVQMTGRTLYNLQCNGATSIQELQQRIRQYRSQQQNAQYIRGTGWEQDKLGQYPTAADIDAVVSDIPVVIWRVCEHICVANTAAMQAANITSDTADPTGGSIDRDPATKQPSGIFRERAVEFFDSILQETPQRQKQYIERGLSECLQNGITLVQTNDERAWPIYKQLVDENKLNIRVQLTIMHSELDDEGIPQANEHYGSGDMLSCDRVKLFADGALGASTAALSEAYVQIHHCAGNHKHTNNETEPQSNSSDDRGILIHTIDALTAKVRKARERGYRIELHAIGDDAADVGLTAFEQSGMQIAERPILTHCQILRDDLVERLLTINAIANVQPQFTVTDSQWLSKRLPAPLLKWAYAWRSLLQHQVHVAGGSDSPIEPPNPLLGMFAAIYRPYVDYNIIRDIISNEYDTSKLPSDVDTTGRWCAKECLTPAEALRIYTSEGAYTGKVEKQLGSIEAGKYADFTILDFNPLTEPLRLQTAKPAQVWVHGKRRL